MELNVSIVIPTRRRPALLRHTLQSVKIAAHGLSDLEVIVCDNDPSRSGEAVASEFKSPSVHYYGFSEELTMVHNWNRALLQAKGKWITILHDDDCLLPDVFTTLRPHLSRDDCIAVYGAAFTSPSLMGMPAFRWSPVVRYTVLHSIVGPPTANPGVFYRRTFLAEAGGYPANNAMTADWELAAHAAMKGKVLGIRRFVAWYRSHTGQTSSASQVAMATSCCLLRARVARRSSMTSVHMWIARSFNEGTLRGLPDTMRVGQKNLYMRKLQKHAHLRRLTRRLLSSRVLVVLGALYASAS